MANADIIATLQEPALGLAIAFEAEHPDAVFTSGRRTIEGQAHAMAVNQAADGGDIAGTYRDTDAKALVLTAVSGLTSEADIEAKLLNVFRNMTDVQLREITAHLDGRAFDIHRDGDAAKSNTLQALLADHIADGGHGTFLDGEDHNRINVWHMQVLP